MDLQVSKRNILVLLSTTVVSSIIGLFTFVKDGGEDTLVLRSGESYSIIKSAVESYQKVNWQESGELSLGEGSKLIIR